MNSYRPRVLEKTNGMNPGCEFSCHFNYTSKQARNAQHFDYLFPSSSASSSSAAAGCVAKFWIKLRTQVSVLCQAGTPAQPCLTSPAVPNNVTPNDLQTSNVSSIRDQDETSASNFWFLNVNTEICKKTVLHAYTAFMLRTLLIAGLLFITGFY